MLMGSLFLMSLRNYYIFINKKYCIICYHIFKRVYYFVSFQQNGSETVHQSAWVSDPME